MPYDKNITVVKGVVSTAVTALVFVGSAFLAFPQACADPALIGAATAIGTGLIAMADNWRKHHADE